MWFVGLVKHRFLTDGSFRDVAAAFSMPRSISQVVMNSTRGSPSGYSINNLLECAALFKKAWTLD